MGAYWRALSDAGITRERLESFDRAIKTDPVFWPEKKDALLREFRNYLTILQVRRVGEEEWGGYQRLCSGTEAYRKVQAYKRRYVRTTNKINLFR